MDALEGVVVREEHRAQRQDDERQQRGEPGEHQRRDAGDADVDVLPRCASIEGVRAVRMQRMMPARQTSVPNTITTCS